jgi:hypothetical protein
VRQTHAWLAHVRGAQGLQSRSPRNSTPPVLCVRSGLSEPSQRAWEKQHTTSPRVAGPSSPRVPPPVHMSHTAARDSLAVYQRTPRHRALSVRSCCSRDHETRQTPFLEPWGRACARHRGPCRTSQRGSRGSCAALRTAGQRRRGEREKRYEPSFLILSLRFWTKRVGLGGDAIVHESRDGGAEEGGGEVMGRSCSNAAPTRVDLFPHQPRTVFAPSARVGHDGSCSRPAGPQGNRPVPRTRQRARNRLPCHRLLVCVLPRSPTSPRSRRLPQATTMPCRRP